MRFTILIFLVISLVVSAGPNDSPSIYWAALANDVNMAKYYIDHGESINIVDKHGLSPLMYAADKGNYEVTKLLLESGADPFLKSKSGAFAIDLSKTVKERELLRSYMQIRSNKQFHRTLKSAPVN